MNCLTLLNVNAMKTEQIEKLRDVSKNLVTPITESLFDAYKIGIDNGLTYLTDITHRNYEATKRRGLITSETKCDDFVLKIREETDELDSYVDWSELADIALVCFAMAEHYGIDLIEEMRKKTEFNEKRP